MVYMNTYNESIMQTPPKKPSVSVRHSASEAAFETLLSSDLGKRFRLSDLAKLVYPFTSPRSKVAASEYAKRLFEAARKEGRIERNGHVHWKASALVKVRHLLDGRRANEETKERSLAITTRCPGKWLAVDCETGELWEGTSSGWRRAGPLAETLLSSVLHGVSVRASA